MKFSKMNIRKVRK